MQQADGTELALQANVFRPILYTEPVFINVYGAKESIARNRFRHQVRPIYRVVVPARQAGNESWAP
jgi:hypothetical protein